MPIEIRELHIRVQVNAGATAPNASATPTPPAADGAADREALVAECVEQVLQILEAKRER